MNLDAMDQSELLGVTDPQLKPYAQLKARAMDLRAEGQIARAQALEERCEEIYRGLPKNARW